MTSETPSRPRAFTLDAADSKQTNGWLAIGYKAVRSVTRSLAARTSAEDQMVQSCPDASPMKWHQAHTTWFFETFVLRPFLPDYKPFREEFRWLFNSYYNSLGDAPRKQSRGSFSRPSLDEILTFRAHVDEAMEDVLPSNTIWSFEGRGASAHLGGWIRSLPWGRLFKGMEDY